MKFFFGVHIEIQLFLSSAFSCYKTMLGSFSTSRVVQEQQALIYQYMLHSFFKYLSSAFILKTNKKERILYTEYPFCHLLLILTFNRVRPGDLKDFLLRAVGGYERVRARPASSIKLVNRKSSIVTSGLLPRC